MIEVWVFNFLHVSQKNDSLSFKTKIITIFLLIFLKKKKKKDSKSLGMEIIITLLIEKKFTNLLRGPWKSRDNLYCIFKEEISLRQIFFSKEPLILEHSHVQMLYWTREMIDNWKLLSVLFFTITFPSYHLLFHSYFTTH